MQLVTGLLHLVNVFECQLPTEQTLTTGVGCQLLVVTFGSAKGSWRNRNSKVALMNVRCQPRCRCGSEVVADGQSALPQSSTNVPASTDVRGQCLAYALSYKRCSCLGLHALSKLQTTIVIRKPVGRSSPIPRSTACSEDPSDNKMRTNCGLAVTVDTSLIQPGVTGLKAVNQITADVAC